MRLPCISLCIMLLLLTSIPIAFTTAQPSLPAGAKGAGMNDVGVTFQDIYSGFTNQAGLAYIHQTSFAIFGEQRFLLAGLNSFAATTALPTKSGTVGLVLQYFGFETYNEQKIGLAYARKLFDQVALGVQFNYLNTRITEYGTKGVISAEVGLQANITQQLRLGVHVSSPFSVAITDEDIVPTILKLGLAYEWSKKVMVAAEVEKDMDYPPILKLGINYKIVDKLSLRAGVGSNPVRNSFGIGIHLKNLTIDVASSFHQILGFTPSVSVIYELKK